MSLLPLLGDLSLSILFSSVLYICIILWSASIMASLGMLSGPMLFQRLSCLIVGVTLSDDFQWSKHISNLSVRASSTLGLLRPNLSQCPQALREQAYISLIRSRLEYCSAIWDPHLVKDI